MIIPRRCYEMIAEDLSYDPYLLKTLPTNSIKYFLDIGASYGLISIQARLNHPKMKVHAFEPDSDLFSTLNKNIENLHIHTYNYALGDGSEFGLEKERKTPLCNIYSKNQSLKSVKSLTLSQMISLCKMDPTDLIIKSDCEGAELYLLNSPEILLQCKVLVAEIHSNELLHKFQDFYAQNSYYYFTVIDLSFDRIQIQVTKI